MTDVGILPEAVGEAELDEETNYEFEEEDIVSPANLFSISSYGIDYPVEALVSRFKTGRFYVPEFQRKYVWSKNTASRFIESLLMGLPIPNIFVFKEPDSEMYLIVDGQQRLMTLVRFFEGKFAGRNFSLSGVHEMWEGKTFDSLEENDRMRLCDASIRTTVFKQDSPKNNMDSVYELFERLNTGGSKLSPQEIRSCIYHGKFDTFLNKLNENGTWREICGTKSKRMRDIEFILRFFAFLEWEHKYTTPMKHFLNLYMEENRNCSDERLEKLSDIFCETIEYACSSLGPRPFRPNKGFNVAVFDSVATSMARSLKRRVPLDSQEAKHAYLELLEDEVFRQGYSTSTADPENVRKRFGKAREAFGVS